MNRDDPENDTIGQRVAIVGCSGSGKSTLARRIARSKGLDYINADELLFKPNWVERTKPEYYTLVEERVRGEAWCFDGNLGGSAHIVLPHADTLIWLDYPRSFVMRRLLKRTIRRAWTREELFSGNRESWRMSFASRESILLYAWGSHAKRKNHYEELWPTLDPAINAIRIRSQSELDALLADAMI